MRMAPAKATMAAMGNAYPRSGADDLLQGDGSVDGDEDAFPQSITRSIADQARTIRIPVHMVETINRLKKNTRKLSQSLGRKPTEEEIADLRFAWVVTKYVKSNAIIYAKSNQTVV